MSTADEPRAQAIKDVVDDVLKLAELVSVPFPGVLLTERVVGVLVDAGLDVLIARADDLLQEQRAAQGSGVSAAESQAATTAKIRTVQDFRRAMMEHVRIATTPGNCACGWAGPSLGDWISHVALAAGSGK